MSDDEAIRANEIAEEERRKQKEDWFQNMAAKGAVVNVFSQNIRFKILTLMSGIAFIIQTMDRRKKFFFSGAEGPRRFFPNVVGDIYWLMLDPTSYHHFIHVYDGCVAILEFEERGDDNLWMLELDGTIKEINIS